MNDMQYEVRMTQGQGGFAIARFEYREHAEEFLKICLERKDGSYGIWDYDQ